MVRFSGSMILVTSSNWRRGRRGLPGRAQALALQWAADCWFPSDRTHGDSNPMERVSENPASYVHAGLNPLERVPANMADHVHADKGAG